MDTSTFTKAEMIKRCYSKETKKSRERFTSFSFLHLSFLSLSLLSIATCKRRNKSRRKIDILTAARTFSLVVCLLPTSENNLIEIFSHAPVELPSCIQSMQRTSCFLRKNPIILIELSSSLFFTNVPRSHTLYRIHSFIVCLCLFLPDEYRCAKFDKCN